MGIKKAQKPLILNDFKWSELRNGLNWAVFVQKAVLLLFFNQLICNQLQSKLRIIEKRLGIVGNNITFALPF